MTSEPTEARFVDAMKETQREVEARLIEIIDRENATDAIAESLRYTLLAGGKRLRPMLCLWTHDALAGQQRNACLDVACAIEAMHTYSLVHDDLPCMDDDDTRRGKPSCHKEFGEAIAVLTGDALLTLCFDILATLGDRWPIHADAVVDICRVMSGAGGNRGLITGQALDLESDHATPSVEMVERIHAHKTAALITASMHAGAIAAGADHDVRDKIQSVGDRAGRAFQIIDDVLDVQMDRETLGKTPGKDAKAGKLTYPAVAGVDASRDRAAALISESKLELAAAVDGPLLVTLLDFIVARSK